MKNILIVDDDRDILCTFSSMLENYFKITTAISYDEAIKCLDLTQFDLVITDIIFSKNYTGIDLIDYIIDNYPYTKIIVISGYYVKELLNKYPILNKPIELVDLLTTIKKVLDIDHLQEK